jgi:beta-mannosidase
VGAGARSSRRDRLTRLTRVEGHEVVPLTDGWIVSSASVGDIPAQVPGTAAGALQHAGLWDPADPRDFDDEDWTFRVRFSAEPRAPDEEIVLRLGGIATVAAVELNGRVLLESQSMFAAHEVDVGDLLEQDNELRIRCAALRPLLSERRVPRARWRTRIVADSNLRFFRTMLLGRAPGFAPRPAAVGPWRPVVLERRRQLAVDALDLRTRLDGDAGLVRVRTVLRSLSGELPATVEVELRGLTGVHVFPLHLDGAGAAQGELRISNAEAWWPHTHGEPVLYDVVLHVGEVSVDAGRVGFTSIESPGEIGTDGVDLHVNGQQIFVRGAVWTPPDLVGLAPDEVRRTVERARDAGMNMLRVPGIGCYESDAFHDACDELGVLVWQDFMFANFDYPFVDADFSSLVTAEVRSVLAALARRPSLAVLCGNTEVQQQAAMLGLEPSIARGGFFDEELPSLIREAGIAVPYVPSAPSGDGLPFRPDRGVAHYFGVGAYLRPLSDARLANVRFAAECLAFANVPDDGALEAPRDAGADWNFGDVRDHYLRLFYDLDPRELRSSDPARYLELSRAVSGEVMAECFGEWRRSASSCSGALVLLLKDHAAGAGWGVLDHRGEPKVAWHHLRRALAPVAVWLSDEGLAGIDVHVANDAPVPLDARLRIMLYRNLEVPVEQVEVPIALAARRTVSHGVEELLGRFVDASYAYRFGPPGHDVVFAGLERDGAVLSQAFRFPVGRPAVREPADGLGLEAKAVACAAGAVEIVVSAKRLAYGVRVQADGFIPAEDAFCVEPGRSVTVTLAPRSDGTSFAGAAVTALNMEGTIHVPAA